MSQSHTEAAYTLVRMHPEFQDMLVNDVGQMNLSAGGGGPV